jgi:hypothetical protein
MEEVIVLDKLRNVKVVKSLIRVEGYTGTWITEPDILWNLERRAEGLSELIYVNNPEFVEKVCRGLDAEIYEKRIS